MGLLHGVHEHFTGELQCVSTRSKKRDLRDDNVEARVDRLLDIVQASGLHAGQQQSHGFFVYADLSFS